MHSVQLVVFILVLTLVSGCGLFPQVDRNFISFSYRAYTYEQFRDVNLAVIAADIAAGRTLSPAISEVAWRNNMQSLMSRVRVNPALFGFDEFVEGALHTMGARNYRQTRPAFFITKCRASHHPNTEFEFEVPDGSTRNLSGVVKLGGVHLRVPAIVDGLLTEDEGSETCDLSADLQPRFIDIFGPQDMLQATSTLNTQLSFGLNGEVWPAGVAEFTVNYDKPSKYGGFDFKAIVLSPTSSGMNVVFIVELGGGAAEE